MKIVNISTNEVRGGAARAANRLHNSFLVNGISSTMLVQKKETDDPTVLTTGSSFFKKGICTLAPFINKMPLSLYRNRSKTTWSAGFFSSLLVNKNHLIVSSDIVIIYWVCGGFFSIKSIGQLLNSGKPVIWRLSDMWPFTGGCHHSYNCSKYITGCGKCPQLNSNNAYDLSRWVWRKKKKEWKTNNLTVVCPSNWIKACVKKSPLLNDSRTELIPTGVDINIFRPIDKKIARHILNLPQDKILILSGAANFSSNNYKGSNYLYSALKLMGGNASDVVNIVFFGTNMSINHINSIKCHVVGVIKDDITLALLYSACDVFVAPSVADNLPNTVLEALSCGTPCVAFNIGGMPDMIIHKHNGYLAEPFSIEDLKEGIIWVLKEKIKYKKAYSDSEHDKKLNRSAREQIVNNFSMDKQTAKYIDLLNSIM